MPPPITAACGYAGSMTTSGDAQPPASEPTAPATAEVPVDVPIEAEIVDPTPTGADVSGYTDAGVPTFDHVRESIERRTATALGFQELSHGSAAGDNAERAFAEREKAAKAKLDEIRKSLGSTPPPSG